MSIAVALFSPARAAAHPSRSAAGAAATGEPRGPFAAGVTWRLPPRVYAPPPRRHGRRAMAVPLTFVRERAG